LYVNSQIEVKKRRVVVLTSHYGIYQYLSEMKEYQDMIIEVTEELPELMEGDIVIGSLPPSLVYEICIQEGIEYRELVIDKPRWQRKPMSYDELIMCNIKIIPLKIDKNNNRYYFNAKYNKKVILITRHKSIMEWLENKGFYSIEKYSVLNKEVLDKIDKNTIVVGILPLHLIYEVNKKGADFFAIETLIPSKKWKNRYKIMKKGEFNIRLSSYNVKLDKT